MSESEIGTSLPSAVDFACEQASATTEFAYKVHSQDPAVPKDRQTECTVKSRIAWSSEDLIWLRFLETDSASMYCFDPLFVVRSSWAFRSVSVLSKSKSNETRHHLMKSRA